MHSPGPSEHLPQTLPAPQSASVLQTTAPGRSVPRSAASMTADAVVVGREASGPAGAGAVVLPVAGGAGLVSRVQAPRTNRKRSGAAPTFIIAISPIRAP